MLNVVFMMIPKFVIGLLVRRPSVSFVVYSRRAIGGPPGVAFYFLRGQSGSNT
jgi:hypothetical protein